LYEFSNRRFRMSWQAAPKDVTGLKEQVRLRFIFDAGDAATDAINFFVQKPTWRPGS